MELASSNPELARLEKIIADGLATFVSVGRAIAKIHREKLYIDDYGTWSHYAKSRWGFSREHCRKLMEAADVFEFELLPLGDKARLITHESQVRALLPLKAPEDKRCALEEAFKAAGGDPPTAQQVSDIVRRFKLRKDLASKHPKKFLPTDNQKPTDGPEPKIICGDSLDPSLISQDSADLICGSPPYNLGISHPTHTDDLEPEEHNRRRDQWLQNCLHWAKDGGRLAVNLPVDVRKPALIPVSSLYVASALQLGWTYMGTIIWHEGSHRQFNLPADPPSKPLVTCPCEVILIFSKGKIERSNPGTLPDISPEDYRAWMEGYWDMPGAHASKAGHPCPYPREIPRRLIQMLTYPGETVVDPWMGTGATIIEAILLGRDAIGIDIEEPYCQLARQNLALARLKKSPRAPAQENGQSSEAK